MSCTGVPPAAGTIQMSPFEYAIRVLSGDHEGNRSAVAFETSSTGVPPPAGIV